MRINRQDAKVGKYTEKTKSGFEMPKINSISSQRIFQPWRLGVLAVQSHLIRLEKDHA
jgi:hypothetical protein